MKVVSFGSNSVIRAASSMPWGRTRGSIIGRTPGDLVAQLGFGCNCPWIVCEALTLMVGTLRIKHESVKQMMDGLELYELLSDERLSSDRVTETLSAHEIARFIGRQLEAGRRKQDIARSMGRSPAYVTQHITLLDLPAPIANAYSSGRVRDITLINELVTAFNKNPKEVGDWLVGEELELTRRSIRLLRQTLAHRRRNHIKYLRLDKRPSSIDPMFSYASDDRSEPREPRIGGIARLLSGQVRVWVRITSMSGESYEGRIESFERWHAVNSRAQTLAISSHSSKRK
jgi:hypothetical protein